METVTISRAEYDRLVAAAEDLDDIKAYDEAKAKGGPSIPAEYVERLIDGESPVRVYRDFRGLTQEQLSHRSGVNRVQIAQIEMGKNSGSVHTLQKLANALEVEIGDLV